MAHSPLSRVPDKRSLSLSPFLIFGLPGDKTAFAHTNTHPNPRTSGSPSSRFLLVYWPEKERARLRLVSRRTWRSDLSSPRPRLFTFRRACSSRYWLVQQLLPFSFRWEWLIDYFSLPFYHVCGASLLPLQVIVVLGRMAGRLRGTRAHAAARDIPHEHAIRGSTDALCRLHVFYIFISVNVI